MQSPSICLPSLPPPPKKTWWLFTTLKITRPDDPRSFSDLLLLTRFSCVRLCATPETAANQAPPSLGFSRQEHWSGLPFPSPMHESEKWKWSCSVSVQLLVTPWTAAYQAPPSMGFSRQEYWSELPLPSPFLGLASMIVIHSIKMKVTLILWPN